MPQIESTAIDTIDYRPDKYQLFVTFTTGRRYVYFDVPAAVYLRFGHADSPAAISTPVSAVTTISANSPDGIRSPRPLLYSFCGIHRCEKERSNPESRSPRARRRARTCSPLSASAAAM